MSFWAHETSLVDENAEIGDDTRIWEFCNVMKNAKIGSCCSIGGGCFIEGNVIIGNRVKIKKGATIGANATIICGHTIGRYALIGAGSVVTRDVPDYALVMGNPSQIKGYVCQCGERLHCEKDAYWCEKCNKAYGIKDENLILVE